MWSRSGDSHAMKASLEDLVQKQEHERPGFMSCLSEMALVQKRGMPVPSNSRTDLIHPATKPPGFEAKRLTWFPRSPVSKC